MKKIIFYILLMVLIIVLMPLIITKGCGYVLKNKSSIENDSQMVKVYFHKEKKIREISLEEYVQGVVAAEMPAAFNIEALKAQAVASRTYVYARMKGIYKASSDVHRDEDICTDPTHCQAWISKDDAMKNWNMLYQVIYWDKIERSVKETKKTIITYNKKIINPLFHSNSGGHTENSEDVWASKGLPYLKAVPSSGEEVAPNFNYSQVINKKEFINSIKKQYKDVKINEDNPLADIKITDVSQGQRVKALKVGNIILKGTEFRTLFGLRSTNFNIEEQGEDIKITTKGYGHGVGMSQWGANNMAKTGADFEAILKYYYQGVDITKI